MIFIKNRYSLLTVCFLLGGCASMEAVQKYADYSQTTIESAKPVAQDFYASCLRANSSIPFNDRSQCSNEKSASKAILMISNVLSNYGAALGALAADELVSYDKDINSLTGEIKKLNANGTNNTKIDAVGNLATFIAKAATSAYQQKEVKTFLIESNTSVVSVSNTLADIIELNYVHAIDIEISAWKSSYRGLERKTREEKPLEWASYSNAQWIIRSELSEKLIAAKNLSKSIRKIGYTNSKLTEDASNLTGKEVAAMVQSFVNDTKPVIKEIDKAFRK